MIRSSSIWPMDRNHPNPHRRETYARQGGGEEDEGGGGIDGSHEHWTRTSQPFPPYVSAPGPPAGYPALTGHGWPPYAPHDPRSGRLLEHVPAAATAVAAATAASSESDQEASPFPPHHHLLAAAQLPFEDLESDPVATTSLDSSSTTSTPPEVDDRKPAAALRTTNPRQSSTAARSGGASTSGRHTKRHSLSHDPFGGLSARLFPSDDDDDDPQVLAHPPDDDRVEGMTEPGSSFDQALQVPTFSHPGGEFYASEGPLYDVHHSPVPSHSFAASPASYAAHAPALHHPYGSPQPSFHHHPYHLAHTGSPMPPPPVPPPQIYRFGHSAPPHYGPRLPPEVGFVDSPPVPAAASAHMYPHTPQGPMDTSRGAYRGGDEGLSRTAPVAKSRPAKKSQPRKVPRPASGKPGRVDQEVAGASGSRRSSSGSGSGSSTGGRGRGGPTSPSRRSSTPHATRAVAAGSSTRSGERTSQVRHSPTDEEIAEAKTPRARAALTNWYKRLYDLIDYKNEHGDCNVPQKYPKNVALGVWVNKQRMEKKFMDEGKKTSMTVSKLRALEEAGFQWAKRKGQPSWDHRFRELVTYKNEHGDCNVPTKYGSNPALGRWVSTQRSQYKLFRSGSKTQMTEDRMNRLHAIGFRWTMTDSPHGGDEDYEGDDHEYYGSGEVDDDDEYDSGGGVRQVGRRLFLSSGGGSRGDTVEMEV